MWGRMDEVGRMAHFISEHISLVFHPNTHDMSRSCMSCKCISMGRQSAIISVSYNEDEVVSKHALAASSCISSSHGKIRVRIPSINGFVISSAHDISKARLEG